MDKEQSGVGTGEYDHELSLDKSCVRKCSFYCGRCLKASLHDIGRFVDE